MDDVTQDRTESRSRFDWLRAEVSKLVSLHTPLGGNFRQLIFDTEGDRA